MIDLAHNLAKNDTKFFGGWVLAGATAHISKGHVTKWENTVLLSKERKSVLQVIGSNGEGNVIKQLEVILVLPKGKFNITKQKKESLQASIEIHGMHIAKHIFQENEVIRYIAVSGDENVIHKGPAAVVPGLCMIAWLQHALRQEELSWRISFLAPVYIDDELNVYETDKGIEAYVESVKVFTIRK